jgi:hypothetical protein
MPQLSANRRFRFSLRAVLVAIALAALALGWVHSVRQEREAAARVQKSNPGAVLLHDAQVTADGELRSAPARWHDRFGTQYFARVAGADLMYPTDSELAQLARLPNLRRLYLVRAVDVTDAGLAHLEGLQNLKLLVLDDADQVTDAGLRSIGRLKCLARLELDLGRRMTPAGIAQLKRDLPHCRMEICAEEVPQSFALSAR